MHASPGPRPWPSRAVAFAWLALVVATAGISSSASAQWLPDRARTEGPGFRTRRVEIHPSFAAEAGVDSNVFLQSANRTPAAMTRLTGAVYLQPRRVEGDGADPTAPPPPRNIDFNLGLNASYYHYFSSRVHDNVGVQFDGSVAFRPQGRVGFELRDSFTRTIRPFTDGTGASSGSISYGQNRNQATANVTFQSRGGVFRGTAGYTADLTLFDSRLFWANASLEHRVAARMVWSFFPRTALVYEGQFASRSYGILTDYPPLGQLVSSNQVVSTIGVNGILTEKLAITLSAGYAAGFFERGDEYDGFVGRAELRYRPRPSILVSTGYIRNYQSSYIGNYMLADTAFANFEATLAGRVVVGAQVSVGFGRTGLAVRADGSFLGNYQTRNDVRVLGRLYGEYRATSWLAITLAFDYLGDYTDFAFTTPSGSTSILPDPVSQYQRFDAWLGVRVFH